MTDQIGVIGAGAWGTTLAIKLAAAERPVTLWAHTAEDGTRSWPRAREPPLPAGNASFPPNVRVATDDAFLAEPHRAFVLAVPSAHLRETLQRVADASLYPERCAAERGQGNRAGNVTCA